MNYLLDSNTVSDFYDRDSLSHRQIAQHLVGLAPEDQVFISIITLYELEYGYNNAPKNKKNVLRNKIDDAKGDFSILPLTEEGSMHFGQLKKSLVDSRKLKKESAKKHNIDIMLASAAILSSCILISADGIYTDLKRQEPRLKVNNWSNK